MLRSAIAFTLAITIVQGYVFDCLDGCECDTDDEVVHCHNGQRSTLALPKGQRLRGFPVIGITYNNLINLPDEETLLNRFPDLKVIDVERNPNFDCDSIKEYNQIKIVSDCDKAVGEIERVPMINRPTRGCDLSCQAQKHYSKLHEYVLNLWQIIQEKYKNFDYDKSMIAIRKFFIEMIAKINKLGEDIKAEINKNNREIQVPSRGDAVDVNE